MFIRKKQNKSGSVSVHIISKARGRYSIVESVGVGKIEQEISNLCLKANALLKQYQGGLSLFTDAEESQYESILSTINNNQIQVVEPELIYGQIGYNQIEYEMFRHLVLTRLYNPGSKLKAIDYLRNYMGIEKSAHEIYRFLDKLNDSLKEQVEDISFNYTKRILRGKLGVVFYDMTTNSIGYDIVESTIFEGHTLIPILQKFEQRFLKKKPIVIADSGLLSKENIQLLEANHFQNATHCCFLF